jgi:hypothetical protein
MRKVLSPIQSLRQRIGSGCAQNDNTVLVKTLLENAKTTINLYLTSVSNMVLNFRKHTLRN